MTMHDDEPAPASGNTDLATLKDELDALAKQLELSIDTARTQEAIAAISDQIVEVSDRATAVGRLLLVAQTDEIARHARAVSAAIPAVEREIEDLDRFERVVESVAAVLDAADEAIRAASLLRR